MKQIYISCMFGITVDWTKSQCHRGFIKVEYTISNTIFPFIIY